MDNSIKSVCFTGHRLIADASRLRDRLVRVLEELIENGADDFYAGGALGFDMMCEDAVIALKSVYPEIKLHLILPCPPDEQTEKWSRENRREFMRLLMMSDDHIIVSESYTKQCMKERNRRLINASQCCICYYTDPKSGTGQTVRMAVKKGIPLINLAEPASGELTLPGF